MEEEITCREVKEAVDELKITKGASERPETNNTIINSKKILAIITINRTFETIRKEIKTTKAEA